MTPFWFIDFFFCFFPCLLFGFGFCLFVLRKGKTLGGLGGGKHLGKVTQESNKI